MSISASSAGPCSACRGAARSASRTRRRIPTACARSSWRSSTTTTRREVEWITQDVGRIFPREWDRFAAAVPPALATSADSSTPTRRSCSTPIPRCATTPPASGVRGRTRTCHWPRITCRNPRYEDPEYRLRFARLVTHYWRNAAFLEDGQLLRDAPCAERNSRRAHQWPVRRQRSARDRLAPVPCLDDAAGSRSSATPGTAAATRSCPRSSTHSIEVAAADPSRQAGSRGHRRPRRGATELEFRC